MNARYSRNRNLWFAISIALAIALILLSAGGQLRPIESVVAFPLTLVSGFINQIALRLSGDIEDISELQYLRQRVNDLEELVGQYQSEQISLREIQQDFERLAALLNYTQIVDTSRFIAAEVIANDTSGLLRGIIVNRGSRDGLAVGMPVVTELGLVGRIVEIKANAAEVLLITDNNSAVSARLQTTRAQGSVLGSAGNQLRMSFIPPDAAIEINDVVMTSGLGGNFPADLIIGRISSIRQFEFELFQEAEVSSLLDFDMLEFVLIITGFLPADLSAFDDGS